LIPWQTAGTLDVFGQPLKGHLNPKDYGIAEAMP
jgi:hypothetical protein